MSTPPNPRRGEIWDICFDPSLGAEIQKTRPAVVNIESVGRLPLRMVVPLTDWKETTMLLRGSFGCQARPRMA